MADSAKTQIDLIKKETLEATFAKGSTFFIVLMTDAVRLNCGFPDATLEQFPGQMMLRFDEPRTFAHMAPEFFDDHLEITLSFDALYRVQIPYCAMGQFGLLWPIVTDWVDDWVGNRAETDESRQPADPEPAKGGGAPFLQLVE